MYQDVTIICASCGNEQIMDPTDFDPVCEECGSAEFEPNKEED